MSARLHSTSSSLRQKNQAGNSIEGTQLLVKDAGPEAMKDPPPEWDDIDEAADESFPASDPPGGY